jgi:hypothetical protein
MNGMKPRFNARLVDDFDTYQDAAHNANEVCRDEGQTFHRAIVYDDRGEYCFIAQMTGAGT